MATAVFPTYVPFAATPTDTSVYSITSNQFKFGVTSLYSSATTGTPRTALTNISFQTAFVVGGAWTIEFWFYPTEATTNTTYALLGADYKFLLQLTYVNNQVKVSMGNGATFSIANGSGGSQTFAINSWHHVALTFTGTAYHLHVDGTRTFTLTSSVNCFSTINIAIARTSTDDASKLLLGTLNNNGSYTSYYQGYLDDFCISNTARYTAATITLPTASRSATADTNVYYVNTFDGISGSTTIPSGWSYTSTASLSSGMGWITASSYSKLFTDGGSTSGSYYQRTTKFGNWSFYENSLPDFGLRIVSGFSSSAFPSTGWTFEGWCSFLSTNGTSYALLSAPLFGQLALTSFSNNGSTSTISLMLGSGSSYTTTVGTSTTVTGGTFHHLALVYGGSTTNTWRLFIDGTKLIDTTVALNPMAGATNFLLSGMPNSTNSAHNGSYTHVCYWDDVIISSTPRYSANFTAPSASVSTYAIDQYHVFRNTFELSTTVFGTNNTRAVQAGETLGTALVVAASPTGLTATPSGTGSLAVSWTAPTSTGGSSITGYSVEYTPSGGSATTVTVSSTSTTLTGLTGGVVYTVRVAAVNSTGTGLFASTTATPLNAPGTPTGVTATAGSSSIAVSWTAPSNNGGSAITSYSVQYTPSGGSTTTVTGITGTSTTLTGLTPSVVYSVAVAAVNVVGAGSYSSTVTATPYTTPGAPTGLAATAGSSSISLSWTAPASDGGSAITSYTLQYTPSGGSTVTVTGVSGTSRTLTGLVPGTLYTVAVAAVNVAGTGSFSSTATATPYTTPGAPTGLTATAGINSIDLSWTAPVSNGGSAITSYTVQYTPAGGSTQTVTGISGTSTTLTGLTARVLHTIAVAAVNAGGAGSFSSTATATPNTVAGAPTSLVATAGTTSISLSWTAPSSNGGLSITSYSVQYTPSGGSTQTVTGISGTSTTLTGLTANTLYTVAVAAVNAAGVGPYSSTATATPYTTPGAPTSLIATAGSSAISLSWTAPSNNGGSAITSYAVQYTPSGGSVQTVTGISGTSTMLTGLTPQTLYTVSVVAVNAAGTGSYSSNVTATPYTTPGAPTGLTATAGVSLIDLAWTAPSSNGGSTITSYTVRYTPSGGSAVTVTGVSETSTTLTGLTVGTLYTIAVAAVNAAGTGSYSSSATATPYTTPGVPTNCIASIPTGVNTATISWTAPTSNGYATLIDYKVVASPTANTASVTVNATSTTAQYPNLTYDQAYTFTVAARNAAGDSSFSDPSNSITPVSDIKALQVIANTATATVANTVTTVVSAASTSVVSESNLISTALIEASTTEELSNAAVTYVAAVAAVDASAAALAEVQSNLSNTVANIVALFS